MKSTVIFVNILNLKAVILGLPLMDKFRCPICRAIVYN